MAFFNLVWSLLFSCRFNNIDLVSFFVLFNFIIWILFVIFLIVLLIFVKISKQKIFTHQNLLHFWLIFECAFHNSLEEMHLLSSTVLYIALKFFPLSKEFEDSFPFLENFTSLLLEILNFRIFRFILFLRLGLSLSFE